VNQSKAKNMVTTHQGGLDHDNTVGQIFAFKRHAHIAGLVWAGVDNAAKVPATEVKEELGKEIKLGAQGKAFGALFLKRRKLGTEPDQTAVDEPDHLSACVRIQVADSKHVKVFKNWN
jgi:hypothetical protein